MAGVMVQQDAPLPQSLNLVERATLLPPPPGSAGDQPAPLATTDLLPGFFYARVPPRRRALLTPDVRLGWPPLALRFGNPHVKNGSIPAWKELCSHGLARAFVDAGVGGGVVRLFWRRDVRQRVHVFQWPAGRRLPGRGVCRQYRLHQRPGVPDGAARRVLHQGVFCGL